MLEIQKQRIDLPPGPPGAGITARKVTEKVLFNHPLQNNTNTWIVALNGFRLEYTTTSDQRVLKHEVDVVHVTLDPGDPSSKTLLVEVAFLLANGNAGEQFKGWADVHIMAELA